MDIMSSYNVPFTSSMSQTLRDSFKSRKLLADPPSSCLAFVPMPRNIDPFAGTGNVKQQPDPFEGASVDSNLALILAVLLCALICTIGLNSIARCALQCCRRRADWENRQATRAANAGLKSKVLMSLPKLIYTTTSILPGLDPFCAICLSEFLEGELVRVLPSCNHSFHVKCIDAWLASHSSCPICRHCLLSNNKKLTCCSHGTQEFPRPLEREGMITNYRGS